MARVSTLISVSATRYGKAAAIGAVYRALADAVAATPGTVARVKGVDAWAQGNGYYHATAEARIIRGQRAY